MDVAVDHSPVETKSRKLRSKVTNGFKTFVIGGGDGRGPWVRRWKDLVNLHVGDLGGADMMTEFQLGLCKRAASLEIQLEQLEAAMSEGQPVDLDLFGRLIGHLRRIAETLGIQRTMRDSNELDLTAYAQSKAYRLASDDPSDIDRAAEEITNAGEHSPADESLVSRVASPPAADLSRQANNPAPPAANSPPPAASPSTHSEPAAAPNSTLDGNYAPPAPAPAAPPAPPAAPIPSPIPTFQRALYSGYRPELRPAPQPASAQPPVRNIAPSWPPEPEAPRRDIHLPSNRPPSEPEPTSSTPPEPPAPSTEIDGLLPSNRPR